MERPPEIHYDQPHLTLSWDPDGGFVCAQWKEDVPGGPMRDGLELGLELIKEKQAKKWLVDSRTIASISPQDVKWVNDDWMPRAVDAGLRCMAFVMAKKVVMQISMKTFIARINGRELENAYFDNIDEARAWLASQG
jgi:hypothetical protein